MGTTDVLCRTVAFSFGAIPTHSRCELDVSAKLFTQISIEQDRIFLEDVPPAAAVRPHLFPSWHRSFLRARCAPYSDNLCTIFRSLRSQTARAGYSLVTPRPTPSAVRCVTWSNSKTLFDDNDAYVNNRMREMYCYHRA